jgi:outer membrane protein assembly factor BamA
MRLPISRLDSALQIPFLEYRLDLGFQYPYALDLPIAFAAQGGIESFEVNPTEQTILKRARTETRIEKVFSPKLSLYYRLFRYERVTTQNLAPTDPATDLGARTESIGSTGPGLVLDFRNDIFNPTRGSFHAFEVELAHPYLLSQDNIGFVLALNRNSFYFPLIQPFSLSCYVGFGAAASILAGQPLPQARLVNELSLGGLGSIRGISPRSRTPSRLSPANMFFYNARIEINSQLFGDLSVATFFDTGQIYPNFSPVDRVDGIGIGIRWKTPVGPIVLDLAQGLGNAREAIKIYFTVGTL